MDTSETMLADRSVIRVAGEDVRGFLQGLVTADTALLAPAAPAWAALLSPQGKALFDFILWADGTDVLIDAEAAQAEALIKRLSLYRLRRAITILPDDLKAHWSLTDAHGVPDPRLAALGNRWLAPEAAATTRRDALARMQRTRAERRQLHQGVLRRPGKHRADAPSLEGQPPPRSRPVDGTQQPHARDLSRAGLDGRTPPRRSPGRCANPGLARNRPRGNACRLTPAPHCRCWSFRDWREPSSPPRQTARRSVRRPCRARTAATPEV
jgi:hypothetical protein